MIKRIASFCSVLRNIQYFYARKPRAPDVPTQSNVLQPFSINKLHDNPGAKYHPKKLGRGKGSGKGKTSGRGMKGHKSRAGGGVHVRFEGGQTPLQKRLPKYGRTIRKRPRQFLDTVNLETINYYVKRGVLNPEQTITIRTLVQKGIVKKVDFGVKILARGGDTITYPLNFEVSDASKMAIDFIKKAGGSVKLIFRTSLKLREHMYPQRFPLPLRDPITPYWRVQKLQRRSKDRETDIDFPKPKWLVEDEINLKSNPPLKLQTTPFVFPAKIVQNSGKIRKRKPKVYRKIAYNLP